MKSNRVENQNMQNRTKNMAGLYLHIPFCASKCAYCDFYSLPATAQRMDDYLAALIRSMATWSATAPTFDTVYLGGGTPSLLGGDRLIRLLTAVRGAFTLADDCEITVECNPDSMDATLLQSLQAVGVNRLSIGVQSAHESELRTLGRRHTFAQAAQAVRLAQAMGFDNISLDLMYGLPDQTQANFLQSVDAVLALEPQHLSCYGLKLEPNTPMGRQNPPLPDDDTQADMYLALCDHLTAAGFAQYEISNWARDGKISRHNAKYWDFTPYLGLGCGAHSLWQGKRFAYVRSLDDFCIHPTTEDEEDVPMFPPIAEYLMLCLRTSGGFDGTQFALRFGGLLGEDTQTVVDKICNYLQGLARHHLTAPTPNGWRLTPQGFLVSNAVITQLCCVVEN